jgi:LmbE family N-acetylglucosaminyl deacetylase
MERTTVRLLGWPDEEVTTRVDVRDLAGDKRRALECHVTQMDPQGPFASMAEQILEAALGWEHYVLVRGANGARGTVGGLLAGD